MLFGRDSQRAHLEQLLDSVQSGPVACIIEGTPGIGKTALWRAAVESARRRGYQVLETAPSEPEAVLAFSGLGDLFERTPDDVLSALPDVQTQALRAALFLGELPESSRELQALPRAYWGCCVSFPPPDRFSWRSMTSSGLILRRHACSPSRCAGCVPSASW